MQLPSGFGLLLKIVTRINRAYYLLLYKSKLNSGIVEKIKLAKSENKKIISIVLTHAGQQTYFEDLVRLSSNQDGDNKFFFLVCDYSIEQHEKINAFKDMDSITTAEYRALNNVDLALHSEIHCRSKNVKNVCFTGHGFFGKHTKWSVDNLKSFNHYFLYGPRDKELIKFMLKGNPGKLSHIKFWETGYPKYDKLFKDKDSYIPPNKINNKFPTILYAPAWDPGSSLRKFKSEIFNILGNLKNINVIVKLHPASLVSKSSAHYSFYTDNIDWRHVLSEFENKYANFVFHRDLDITPLTKYCDLLITDFSSVSLGFLMLGKPVIMIDCPEYYAKTLPAWGEDGNLSKNNPLFNNGREHSTIIDSIAEIPRSISQLLKREIIAPSIANDLLYNPGKGAVGMLNAINSILEQKNG